MEKQDTQRQKNNKKKKIYNLLLGFVFIAVGCFRLYGHYFKEANYDNLRLVVSAILVCFGVVTVLINVLSRVYPKFCVFEN